MQPKSFTVRARSNASRGFTMVELMAVVAIVGVLALIATTSVRKFVRSSKTSEAIEMISNIKGAQENYKDETFRYLNVSTDLTTDSSFYPNNPLPGKQKMNFAGAGDGAAKWQELGVKSTAVLFVYATVAGAANTAPTALGSDITVGNWPGTVPNAWYIVKARARLGDTADFTSFASASFSNELYSTQP